MRQLVGSDSLCSRGIPNTSSLIQLGCLLVMLFYEKICFKLILPFCQVETPPQIGPVCCEKCSNGKLPMNPWFLPLFCPCSWVCPRFQHSVHLVPWCQCHILPWLFLGNLISFLFLCYSVYHQHFAVLVELFPVVFCPTDDPINLSWTLGWVPAHLSLGRVARWGSFLCVHYASHEKTLQVAGCAGSSQGTTRASAEVTGRFTFWGWGSLICGWLCHDVLSFKNKLVA